MKSRSLFSRWIVGLGCLVVSVSPSLEAVADEPLAGLVLHYNFDYEPSKRIVPDKTSLHNDGHVAGARWTSDGKQGGAMEFSATRDYVEAPHTEALNLQKMTLAAWFKTSKSGAERRILEKGSGRGYDLSIAESDPQNPAAGGRLAFAINGRHVCLSDLSVVDGAWHHGVAVFDGKEMRLYVDGILQKSITPCTEPVAVTKDALVIGLDRVGGVKGKDRSFEGWLDEVMIFNRALTADEIKGLLQPPAPTATPKVAAKQIAGRLRELQRLYDEGLLTESFYKRKVAECEASVEDAPSSESTASKNKK